MRLSRNRSKVNNPAKLSTLSGLSGRVIIRPQWPTSTIRISTYSKRVVATALPGHSGRIGICCPGIQIVIQLSGFIKIPHPSTIGTDTAQKLPPVSGRVFASTVEFMGTSVRNYGIMVFGRRIEAWIGKGLGGCV